MLRYRCRKNKDNLLAQGKRVAAVGGSDAHAFPARLGPLKRTLFPYRFHFTSINTHVLTQDELSGDYETDHALMIAALARGNAFIGYDDRGIEATGTVAGGYFADSDGSGNAYIGYGDRGIQATGSVAGGYFTDSNGSGYAYLDCRVLRVRSLSLLEFDDFEFGFNSWCTALRWKAHSS